MLVPPEEKERRLVTVQKDETVAVDNGALGWRRLVIRVEDTVGAADFLTAKANKEDAISLSLSLSFWRE